ncbi:MAG: phospholipase D-like domain-containing protein [Gammaproteobacteria bacterium]
MCWHTPLPTASDSPHYQHAISHNKVVIYDSAVVQTGSFNLTTSAERHNAENAVFLDDHETVAKFEANWETHRAHSAETR